MRDATRIATAGFGRNAAAGLVGDRELDVLRLLAPHMRRAVTISNMLDAAKIAASSFESALDTLNVGIFLVNSETRIIHANLAARQMLVEGCPVRSILGKLQLAQPAATAALSAAIAKADGDEAGMGRSGIGVPTLGAGGQPHLAHVLPLRQGTVRQRLVPAAVAAVFIAPSQAGPPVPAAALGALYDLTPAEARILVDIAAGRTPSATALTLGVAEATVRTHLARVFAKTGTSRQADLVRLVASLNFPCERALSRSDRAILSEAVSWWRAKHISVARIQKLSDRRRVRSFLALVRAIPGWQLRWASGATSRNSQLLHQSKKCSRSPRRPCTARKAPNNLRGQSGCCQHRPEDHANA